MANLAEMEPTGHHVSLAPEAMNFEGHVIQYPEPVVNSPISYDAAAERYGKGGIRWDLVRGGYDWTHPDARFAVNLGGPDQVLSGWDGYAAFEPDPQDKIDRVAELGRRCLDASVRGAPHDGIRRQAHRTLLGEAGPIQLNHPKLLKELQTQFGVMMARAKALAPDAAARAKNVRFRERTDHIADMSRFKYEGYPGQVQRVIELPPQLELPPRHVLRPTDVEGYRYAAGLGLLASPVVHAAVDQL